MGVLNINHSVFELSAVAPASGSILKGFVAMQEVAISRNIKPGLCLEAEWLRQGAEPHTTKTVRVITLSQLWYTYSLIEIIDRCTQTMSWLRVKCKVANISRGC